MGNDRQILINLIPIDHEGLQKRRFIICYLALTMVILITAVVIYKVQQEQITQLNLEQSYLQQETRAYKQKEIAVKQLTAINKQIKQRQDDIKKAEQAGIPASIIMSEIEQALPPNVMLVGLQFDQKKLILSGFTDEQEQVAIVLSGLRNSSRFSKVILTGSKLDQETGEIQFAVESEWR